jgi:hypothetical protein
MDYAVTLRATVHAQGSPYTCWLQRGTRRNEKSASVGLIKYTKNGFVGVQRVWYAAVRRAISWSIVSGGVRMQYLMRPHEFSKALQIPVDDRQESQRGFASYEFSTRCTNLCGPSK